jgi:hypothetical protein
VPEENVVPAETYVEYAVNGGCTRSPLWTIDGIGVITSRCEDLLEKTLSIDELVATGSNVELSPAKGADSVVVADRLPGIPRAILCRRALFTPGAATVLFALVFRKQLPLVPTLFG